MKTLLLLISLLAMPAFAGNSPLEDYEGNLLRRARGTPTEVDAWNARMVKELNQLPFMYSPGRAAGFSVQELKELYHIVERHPIADQNNLHSGPKYDPDGYGFCFGRATIAHIEALRSGIDKNQIRKVWAIGSMGKGMWQYHVTTIVRGSDKRWYAIDPIMGRHITVEEWYGTMKTRFDDDGRMTLYSTSARRAFPNSDEAYNWATWKSDSVLARYFHDLMEQSRKDSRHP